MPGTGIWLSDPDFMQSGGAIWAQQQIQNVQQRAQAGQDWAAQQIARAQEQARQQMAVAMQPAPTIAPPTPTPVPTTPPPPDQSAAPAPVPPPAPAPAPAPLLAPTPPPAPVVSPPTSLPLPTTTPQPPQPDLLGGLQNLPTAAQSWASDQINNLFSNATSGAQPPSPLPVPGLPTSMQTPSAGPTATPATTPTPAPPPAPTTPGAPAAPQTAAPTTVGQGQQDFVNSLQPLAQQVAARTGLDPNAMLAIAANETGWGKSSNAQQMNNLFSLQGDGSNGSRWASYSSPQDSFDAFANLIQSAPRYAQAWADRANPGQFIDDLRNAGYVVDEPGFPAQGWVDQVKSILGGLPAAASSAASNVAQGAQNLVQSAGHALMTPTGTTGGRSLSDPAAQSTQDGPSGQQWYQIAAAQLSKPYIWGSAGGRSDFSTDPAGFDCSGFVSYVMKTGFGVDLPAFTGSAYSQTRALGANEQPRPGDVVFYNMDSADPHQQHIALYIGDGKIIQAGGTQEDVNIASANQPVGSAPEYRRPTALDNAQGNLLAQAQVGGLVQTATSPNPASSSANGGGQPLTMGANQPAIPPLSSLSALDPYGAGQTVGSALSNLGTGTQNVLGAALGGDLSGITGPAQNVLNAALGIPNQALQRGQDLLQTLSNAPAAAQSLLGQAGNGLSQDLLQPGQSLLGQAASELTSPNLASDLYQRSPIGLFNQNMQGLGQDLGGPAALNYALGSGRQDLGQAIANVPTGNVPLLSGLASLGTGLVGNLLQAPGVLDSAQTVQDLQQKYGMGPHLDDQGQFAIAPIDLSQMTPEDASAYQNAMVNVGGIVGSTPTGPGPAATAPADISPGDWLRGFYRGGIISSPSTMLDVASNSGIMPVISYLTGGARDLLGAIPELAAGEGFGPAAGRMQGRAIGAASGITQAADQFLSQLTPSARLADNPESLIGRADPGLQQIAAYGAEGAGALHGAFSQVARTVVTNDELGALGGEIGARQGLTGQDLHDFVQNFIQNPPADAKAAADAVAARASATQDLGWLSGGIGQAVSKIPDPIGSALFPVYRKGMQIASRLAEFYPGLGTAGTAIDVARGLLGNGPYAGIRDAGSLGAALRMQPEGNVVGPLAERLTNNAIGTALGLWLASKADINQQNGPTITGSWQGLTPAEQDVLRASGQIPNGIQFPDGTWHDWSKVPPVLRGPLMAAGAYGDSQHAYDKALATQQAAGPLAYGVEDPRFAQAETLLNEIGTQFVNQTPLRNLSSAVDLLTGGGGGSTALQPLVDLPSSILGGLVPGSALMRSAAQATDPYERQVLRPETMAQVPTAILQNVQQDLPELRESLPARVDVAGRSVQNPLQGLGAILPLHAGAGQPSPVLAAMAASGVTPTAVPTSIQLAPNLAIRLSPAQQQQYERYRGAILDQAAANLPQGDPRATALALTRIDQVADQAARRMLLGDIANSAGGNPLPYANATGALAPRVGYGATSDLTQQLLMAQQRQLMNSLFGQAPAQSLAALYPA